MTQQTTTLTFTQNYLILGRVDWTKNEILQLANDFMNLTGEDKFVDVYLNNVAISWANVRAEYPLVGAETLDEQSCVVIDCYVDAPRLEVRVGICNDQDSRELHTRTLEIPELDVAEHEQFVFTPLSLGGSIGDHKYYCMLNTHHQPENERQLIVTLGPVLLVFEDISVTILRQL